MSSACPAQARHRVPRRQAPRLRQAHHATGTPNPGASEHRQRTPSLALPPMLHATEPSPVRARNAASENEISSHASWGKCFRWMRARRRAAHTPSTDESRTPRSVGELDVPFYRLRERARQRRRCSQGAARPRREREANPCFRTPRGYLWRIRPGDPDRAGIGCLQIYQPSPSAPKVDAMHALTRLIYHSLVTSF